MAFSLIVLIGNSAPSRAANAAQPVEPVSAAPTAAAPVPATTPGDTPATLPAARIVWGPNVPVVQQVPAPLGTPVGDAASAEYASLDQAVDAQDAAASDESLRCLAGAVFYEAKGEPLLGQLAVAEVIINRAKSGRYPEDLCSVVKQRGQFGFVRGGTIPAIDPASGQWRTAVAVAKVALADAWDSPAGRALFFNAAGRAPGNAVRVAAIGNHVFYR